MKKSLLLLAFIPGFLMSQTITSVQNGNASNPFTWDCLCFPSTSSDIIINHDLNMDVDWAVLSGGSITVNASGSLIQDADRSILVDGIGSQYINNGTSSFTNVAYTNGASGTN